MVVTGLGREERHDIRRTGVVVTGLGREERHDIRRGKREGKEDDH